jgi:hypothetical protein
MLLPHVTHGIGATKDEFLKLNGSLETIMALLTFAGGSATGLSATDAYRTEP